MAQIFRPSANTLCKVSIVVLLFIAVGGLCALDIIHKSPYVRYTKVAQSQPIPFSHKHHTNMGIDCRYCHVSVEEAAFATVPPTLVCMNCHSQIYKDQELIKPIIESWETDESIQWNRVHDLPGHAYFNHSIHVAKGIGCTTCHGPVGEMNLVWREHPLFMQWCLDCHREPEKFIRPREEVFNPDYVAPKNQEELGMQLVEEYNVPRDDHRLADCWICHR